MKNEARSEKAVEVEGVLRSILTVGHVVSPFGMTKVLCWLSLLKSTSNSLQRLITGRTSFVKSSFCCCDDSYFDVTGAVGTFPPTYA